MKLTLKLRADEREDTHRTRDEAIKAARRYTVEAKRALCANGRTTAYVDGHFVQPVQGRTDRRA